MLERCQKIPMQESAAMQWERCNFPCVCRKTVGGKFCQWTWEMEFYNTRMSFIRSLSETYPADQMASSGNFDQRCWTKEMGEILKETRCTRRTCIRIPHWQCSGRRGRTRTYCIYQQQNVGVEVRLNKINLISTSNIPAYAPVVCSTCLLYTSDAADE